MPRASYRSGRSSSENISFRLHKDQLNKLREEAEEKRISLNTLVNQIVDSYVNYYSSASKADVIPITRQEIMMLLEGYNEDQIKAMSERAIKIVREETVLQLNARYDFKALLDTFGHWMRATGFPYRHIYPKHNDNNRHTFIIQHDMGRKYSLFTAVAIKIYFEPLVNKPVQYSITDNAISITVEGRA